MHQGRLTSAVWRWSKTPAALRSAATACPYSTAATSSSSVPKQVEVVVCGGGITGLSVAYHLAKRGCSVALFERSIGCGGATGVSAGFLSASMLWQDASVQKITQTSMKLYTELHAGDKFRFNRCGRVYLAQSDTTVTALRRMYAKACSNGEAAELVDDNTEMLERWPLIATEDVQLALFIADDAVVDPIGLCRELSKRATQQGATIIEQCAVKEVLIGDEAKVYGVETDQGFVECSNFVDAAGVWCGTIPVKGWTQTKMRVAAQPCTYSYLQAGRLPNVNYDNHPIVNDIDAGVFLRPSKVGTTCGGFVLGDIRAITTARSDPSDWHWHAPEADWDSFYPVLQRLTHRAPALLDADHGDLVCGAESYTSDVYPLVGERPQARGYFVAGGLNGQGLSLGGGLGSVLADWITTSLPGEVAKIDVARFLDLHSNPQYLQERAPEIGTMTHKVLYQSHQFKSARNLRMSPIHHQLKERGAVFGEIMGYERPLWFAGSSDVRPPHGLYVGQDDLMGKPEWYGRVAKEYEACRERVGIIDMSNFSKFEITGDSERAVVSYLQRLCSADIDKPVGTTVYTGMQNEEGGYVTDCTVSRLEKNQYFIVAPTVQQVRCRVWMERWAKNKNVYIKDVTAMYTALNVIGPSSRYLMQDVTGTSMHPSDFPTFHCKEVNVGLAAGIRAISVTHCGELGWVLYIPNEVAQNVYERIVEAGRGYGLMHAGYYTLRHLRIEKFYVYWGQDIDATTTPLECGRGFRVDFDKSFIGKKALERQLEEGVPRRFVQLLVDRHDPNTDPWPQGGEPIYRDDKCVGLSTSAVYGFTLACQVCLGYVEDVENGERRSVTPEFVQSGKYEIDIAGKRFPVRVNLHSPSLPMVSSEHPTHYRPTQ